MHKNKCTTTPTTTNNNTNVHDASLRVLTVAVDDCAVLPTATLIDSKTNTGDEFHASTCLAKPTYTLSHKGRRLNHDMCEHIQQEQRKSCWMVQCPPAKKFIFFFCPSVMKHSFSVKKKERRIDTSSTSNQDV